MSNVRNFQALVRAVCRGVRFGVSSRSALCQNVVFLAIAGLQSASLCAQSSDHAPVDLQAEDAKLEGRFQNDVAPFLKTYCLNCHGAETQEAKLDLSPFNTAKNVADAHQIWEIVLERMEAGEMPPADAKAQPTTEQRLAVIRWIHAARDQEANRNAGDPGPVLARRLSNEELHSVDRLLIVPVDEAERAKHEASFAQFCSVIPDAFYISERGRDYVNDAQKQDGKKGRLLSAGFHSMMGYFRDRKSAGHRFTASLRNAPSWSACWLGWCHVHSALTELYFAQAEYLMNQQEIILELTGPLQHAAASDCMVVPCAGVSNLGTVLLRFLQACPSAAKVLGDVERYRIDSGPLPPGLLIVRDAVTIPSRLETIVSGGERLTLLPMLSGG